MEKTAANIINDIVIANGGYVTRKELNAASIPSAYLSSYIKKNGLIRCGTGFYAKDDWIEDEYLIFQYEYPKCIFSFYCAAYLHGLGDFIPPFIEVTGPKNYRPFPLPRERTILHTDIKEETYSLGVVEVKTIYGNTVKTYDIEKTVCDFIKYREKIDSESFVKCINSYKKRKDKDINKLMKYARIMKVEKTVRDIMEVVLNED